MILLLGLFFIISLVAESYAIFLLLNDMIGTSVAIHFFSLLLMNNVFMLFVKDQFKNKDYIFYGYLFLLCFFVPIFGIAISLFILIVMFRRRKSFFEFPEMFDDSINLTQLKPIKVNYGAGGAFTRLMKQDESTMQRTKALFTLAQGKLSGVNKLMYELLPDSSDEIRLLAYNILDQQESNIDKDIEKLVTLSHERHVKKNNKTKFDKNLAMLYWELTYRQLVLKELEEITLKKAHDYVLKALQINSNDTAMWVLLGKIYQRMREYKKAEEAFNKTLNYNVAPSQVLPYLAEIRFNLRDYAGVKKYLSASDSLEDIPMFDTVVAFWRHT